MLIDDLRQKATEGNTFAVSLVRYYQRHGHLTPKQESAAKRMLSRGTAIKVEFGKIESLLKTAANPGIGRKALKRPKITLSSGLVFSLATELSRTPGDVFVSVNERFIGRIDSAGHFHVKFMVERDLLEEIQNFARSPFSLAIADGKLSGRCCFCSLPLTDARSTEKGYGPICAQNWGLPWGEK